MKIYTFCLVFFLGLTACNNSTSTDNKPVDQVSIDAQLIADYVKANDLTGQRTPSGIYYVIEKIGDGPSAKGLAPTSNVTVHYHGTFLDGKVFDSSVKKGKPFSFELREVIAGWQESVKLLKMGGKGTFLIPSHLAYGQKGFPGFIPPNKVLRFEVELLAI